MREFNGGDWTQARFNSFVKSALRAASRGWPPKYKTLNEACVGQRTNIKTGRLAKHYTCSACQVAHPAKDVQVDHYEAVINPSVGFVSWDSFIDNLFCEQENLQVLCKPCHEIKSSAEKQIAKERKANAK
jgi:hypothetical protein